MRTIASASALLLGLLAAGCNGELVGGGQRPPARMDVISGDLQNDTVGKELAQPLVVRVLDDRDRPVSNQLVNFVVTAGGGSVFAGSAITNAKGEARERWTLGTVAGDTQRVEARAVDASTGQAIVFATFRAVGVPDVPASMSAASAVEGSAPPEMSVSPAPAVRVADQYGNGVPGVSVTWVVASGGGTVAPSTVQTNAAGVATANWILGPAAGAQGLTATAAGLPPVQFAARLLLPGSVSLVTGPFTVAGGSSTEYIFQVRDSLNRALPNTAVEWTLRSPGGATLTSASAKSGADGLVRATLNVTSVQATHHVSVRAGTVTSSVPVSMTGPMSITEVMGAGGRGIIEPNGYAKARITSTAGAVTAARASLVGREVAMSYDPATGKWIGYFDMTGVPGGTYTGTITASDAVGNSYATTFTAIHDANPVIEIVEPAGSAVTARGSIRIRATCSWQLGTGPGNCATLYSTVRTETAVILPYAQGRSEIDVTVPLPAGPATVRITVQWNDRQAVYFLGKDTVEVTVTP